MAHFIRRHTLYLKSDCVLFDVVCSTFMEASYRTTVVQAGFVYSLGRMTGCNFHIKSQMCVAPIFMTLRHSIFEYIHALVRCEDGKVSINIWNKTRMKICFAFDLRDFIEFIRTHSIVCLVWGKWKMPVTE